MAGTSELQREELYDRRYSCALVLTALACAAAFALAHPAMAAMVNLKADLKATSEVPPTDSKGSGSVTATFDTASKKLSWKGSVFGPDRPGHRGAFPWPRRARQERRRRRSDAGADQGPFEGSATLNDAQAAELMDGKWYVNVHTAANKGGEIRGQVDK